MLKERFAKIEMALKNEKILSQENKMELMDLIWKTCCGFLEEFEKRYPNLSSKAPQIMFNAKNDVNKFYKFYDPNKHNLMEFVFFIVSFSMNSFVFEDLYPNAHDDLKDKRALMLMKDLMSPLEKRIMYQVLRFHGCESDIVKLQNDVTNELHLDKKFSSVIILGSLHAFETLYYTTLYDDLDR